MQHIVYIVIFLSGIKDKLISTNGYCIMITDEGVSFLSDLKRYETNMSHTFPFLLSFLTGKVIK